MAALFARKIALTDAYTAVAAGKLFDGNMLAASDNVGVAYMKGDNGSDVPIPKGVVLQYNNLDLGTLQLKGNVNDLIHLSGAWYTNRDLEERARSRRERLSQDS